METTEEVDAEVDEMKEELSPPPPEVSTEEERPLAFCCCEAALPYS